MPVTPYSTGTSKSAVKEGKEKVCLLLDCERTVHTYCTVPLKSTANNLVETNLKLF